MKTSLIVVALLLVAPSCKEKDGGGKTESVPPIQSAIAKDAAVAKLADASQILDAGFAPTREPSSVEFEVHPSLGKLPASSMLPGCIHAANEKPDGASPPALVYRIEGGEIAESCTFPDLANAGLYVFDRSDFARIVPGAKKDLESLESLLAERPEQPRQTPFAPFIDANQDYVARVKYIDFDGGSGILAFTEFSPEPDVLFKAPLYVFEGLSSDRDTYVVGLFPVAVDISVPSFQWAKEDFAETSKRHKVYAEKIRVEANGLPSKSIVPRPEAIERTVRSLTLAEIPKDAAAED